MSALKRCNGHVRGLGGAAQVLGIGEATLFVWLREDADLRRYLDALLAARRGKAESAA
jgi:hypothetical protein